MIHPGLCSITFRNLSQRQVVGLAAGAGLAGIEWGGDVHCPHGDSPAAMQAGAMTRDAGLTVASYGSYYRAGPAGGRESPTLEAVLESATAMGAPIIRIWAGGFDSGHPGADEAHWAEVVIETRRIADAAAAAGMRIAFEYHAGSLTDTLASTLRLLAAVEHDNVGCYWQPPFGSAKAGNITAIKALGEKLSNLHVFHWVQSPGGKIDHRPLAEGESDWLDYFHEADALGGDRWALIEFVRDGSADAFRQDAATLKRSLAALEETS